jgi:protein involved in polysaccharide export with SLBB domain
MPPYPNTVLLTGEVMNPGLYKYVKGTRISDYFELSGGKTENGGRVYYTFPSGRTNRLKFLHNPKVHDGTVIRVLPKEVKEKKEETDWGAVVKESTAILSSAMMVIYLSQQIK